MTIVHSTQTSANRDSDWLNYAAKLKNAVSMGGSADLQTQTIVAEILAEDPSKAAARVTQVFANISPLALARMPTVDAALHKAAPCIYNATMFAAHGSAIRSHITYGVEGVANNAKAMAKIIKEEPDLAEQRAKEVLHNLQPYHLKRMPELNAAVRAAAPDAHAEAFWEYHSNSLRNHIGSSMFSVKDDVAALADILEREPAKAAARAGSLIQGLGGFYIQKHPLLAEALLTAAPEAFVTKMLPHHLDEMRSLLSDRAAHQGAIEAMYGQAPEAVAKVAQKMPADTGIHAFIDHLKTRDATRPPLAGRTGEAPAYIPRS